ncbi:MAG: hypothetical protein ACK5WU_08155, partial [Alphaproteobacteria bacterium]
MPSAARRPDFLSRLTGLAGAFAATLGALAIGGPAWSAPTPPFPEMRYAAVVVDAETGEVLF